jgi:hypothetical protein
VSEVTDRLDKLRRLAYRYAGRAVLCIIHRRGFGSVSLSLEGGPCGEVALRPLALRDAEGALDRAKVEREIVIELGGPIAEKIAAGKLEWRGTGRDVLGSGSAIDLASEVSDSHEAALAQLKYLWLRTRDTLQEPEHWAATQMLAADLLDRQVVSARRARELFRQTRATMRKGTA